MQTISGGIEDNEIRCDCGVEWETTGTDRQGSEEEESEGVGERKGQIQVEWKRGKVRERGRKREVEKKEKERETNFMVNWIKMLNESHGLPLSISSIFSMRKREKSENYARKHLNLCM